MGGGDWNRDFYKARQEERVKSNTDAFDYHRAVAAAPSHEQKIHELMDPKGITREARDSLEHPDSLPIAVILDITGSQKDAPKIFQGALPQLMNTLIDNKLIEHPQVLAGCIGDANDGKGPLQVGQFESDIRIDDTFTRMWLQGGGGGGGKESYELAFYFFARKVSFDSLEKRGKKGYLYVTADERFYDTVSRVEVERWFGDGLEADLPTTNIIEEVKAKWNVFIVIPQHTDNGRDRGLQAYWRDVFGSDHVLILEEEKLVCELIALNTAVHEGTTTLAESTLPASIVQAVAQARGESVSARAGTSAATARL